LVGDDEILRGSGDGDDPAMMRPMVIWTDQDKVFKFGEPAVLPVPDVMGVQTAGRPAARHDAAAVAVLQCAAQPAADLAGVAPGADDLAIAFEPHLAGGVTRQVSAVGVREQRTQMQRRDAALEVDVHDDGGVLPVRAADGVGVPAGFDDAHDRIDGVRERWRLLGHSIAVTVGVSVCVCVTVATTVGVGVVV
jgi:hypothetical protein